MLEGQRQAFYTITVHNIVILSKPLLTKKENKRVLFQSGNFTQNTYSAKFPIGILRLNWPYFRGHKLPADIQTKP